MNAEEIINEWELHHWPDATAFDPDHVFGMFYDLAQEIVALKKRVEELERTTLKQA